VEIDTGISAAVARENRRRLLQLEGATTPTGQARLMTMMTISLHHPSLYSTLPLSIHHHHRRRHQIFNVV